MIQRRPFRIFVFALSLIIPTITIAADAPPQTRAQLTFQNSVTKITSPGSQESILNETISATSTNTPDIIATLNGLDALTEKVIPAVAEAYGFDDLSYDVKLSSGTLEAYDAVQAKWKTCATFTIRLDSDASLPIGKHDVTAAFKEDNVVTTSWNVVQAALDGDVSVSLDWGDDANNLFCIGWDILTAGQDLFGDTRLSFATDGLSGTLTAQLEDVSASTVAIESIQEADLAFDEITIGNSDVINFLVDLGFSVADLFGASCANIEDCVNELIDAGLANTEVRDGFAAVLNDAISESLSLSGGTDDAINLNYTVALADLNTTDDNQLKSEWDVTLSSDAASDPCADAMTESAYGTLSKRSLGGDIDLAAGFPLISHAAYEIGKSGKFCRPFSGSLTLNDAGDVVTDGEFFNSVINGITLRYSGEIIPNGALVVSGSSTNQKTITAKTPVTTSIQTRTTTRMTPMPVIQFLTDPIYLTFPVRLADFEATLSLGSLSATADITATLKVAADVGITCENGLALTPKNIWLEDISGQIVIGDLSIDASEIASTLNNSADNILDGLDPITLLPKINSLGDLGLGLKLDQIAIDADSLRLAVNVSNNPTECEDNTQLDAAIRN